MTGSYLEGKSLNGLQLIGVAALIAAAFFGVFSISDPEALAGYIAILLTSAAPAILWIRRGGVGLPILPIVGIGYLSYYGVAIISGNTGRYEPDQILAAAFTVAAFLVAATLTWSGLAFRRSLGAFSRDRELQVDFALPRLILCALLFGLLFEVGSKGRWWQWMDTSLGTFRSLAMASMSVGCFLFGTALGRGRLKAFDRYTGYALIFLLVLIEISSLIMHTAMVLVGGVLIGYIISSKRIPWIAMTVLIAFAGFLHGAESMERERYWSPQGDRATIGLLQIPELMTEWISEGVGQIGNGGSDSQDLAARASQLNMLLLVEEQTPRNIEFLDGATYANFPRMLVPRFLSRDKIASQENLGLLSVRYGLETPDQTDITTIAWNLVPEGYANFGYPGVVAAGLAFGGLVGLLTWVTAGAPPISLRGLIGLISLVTLLDMEYDFSYLTLNLLQAMFSISVFYVGVRFVEFFLGKKVVDHPASGLHPARGMR